jgi:hypothetical protein
LIPRTLPAPVPSRVYDALLDGYHNGDPDRQLARQLAEIYPGVRRVVRSNRAYLAHAVLLASSRLGITQFLDLGSGFPAAGSVRDTAQQAGPEARVACVDRDRAVHRYGSRLAREGVKNFSVATADIRDPGAVLAHPAVTDVIALAEPVCAVFGLVANVMEQAQAREVIAGYASALAPGSAVVLTVTCNEDEALFGRLSGAWQAAGDPLVNYTPDEAAALLAGLEVLPPGVRPAVRAGGARLTLAGGEPFRLYVLAGIGIKPPALRRRPAQRLRCLPGLSLGP